MTESKIIAAFQHAFHAPVYEPVQRNKDGMRWIKHRFLIKGGISVRDIAINNLTADNMLLRRVIKND